MNNLTSSLLIKHYDYTVEEYTKQGLTHNFDSGIGQRVVGTSIPAIDIQISYRGLSRDEYEVIRSVYENNHSNTFILDLDSFIDKRPDIMDINASVWAFKEFKFTVDAGSRLYSGFITLVTSVFFNYSMYQDLFTQSSSYTPNLTTNQDFKNVLVEAPAYKADLQYYNNALFSQIGQSRRHAKNKGGLKRAWTYHWVLNESSFIKLLTFYRKKSGIMGTFGMPSLGLYLGYSSYYVENGYIEDQDDYVFYDAELDNITNARFLNDSFKYNKNINNLYYCEAEIIEVKNG